MKINRGEPDHPHWKKPFTHKEMAVAYWGLSACSLALGLAQWLNPPKAPFTGRWGWLNSMTTSVMGEQGPVFFQIGIAAILILSGCVKWATYRSQTPR
ncbi:hypothetical protein [Polaromonas sp. UC242_47]|uniref:hypothetical protein n=1 Tax=Polaromonas sp. UC242_47 TaxID=3374626 RepID=UPI0037AA3684